MSEKEKNKWKTFNNKVRHWEAVGGVIVIIQISVFIFSCRLKHGKVLLKRINLNYQLITRIRLEWARIV